jgi:hypothetical protein
MSIKTFKEGSLYIMNTSTAFTTEATTEDTYVYQIDDTDKRVWNPNVDITISTGTLDTSYMDEGINWFEGSVKLNETDETLTVTGEYVTLQKVGYISNYNLTSTLDTGEITSIEDGWKKYTPLGKSCTLSLSRYRFDTLFDHISDDNWILIKLYEDADSGFWVKCLRSSIGYTKAINAVDTEALTFTVSSPIAYFSA